MSLNQIILKTKWDIISWLLQNLSHNKIISSMFIRNLFLSLSLSLSLYLSLSLSLSLNVIASLCSLG